jgi:thiamine phosphate synthase YjbQ (UPF0047 family)
LNLVNAQHITASVFINDDESGPHHDYEVWFERLAPHVLIDQYLHNRTGEDVCCASPPARPERRDKAADAHLKRAAQGGCTSAAETGCTVQIMCGEAVIAVTNGCLNLSTWVRIFCGEFDGRRDTLDPYLRGR